jgi:hypothetical protein
LRRYRLVCTEAQVVVAVHAAGEHSTATPQRQLSFAAFLSTHARLRAHAAADAAEAKRLAAHRPVAAGTTGDPLADFAHLL